MNKQLIVAQVKRELWENKVSFVYTPALITLLIFIIAIAAAVYSNGKIDGRGVHFNISSNSVPLEAGVGVSNESAQMEARPRVDKNELEKFDVVSSVMKQPDAFNAMVVGTMYANCALLYLVFFLVFCAYALRCLFDDRKNKDILFWRSMPVSETTNVLVKLGMIVLVGPLIMLILNLTMTCLVFLGGLIFLGAKGVSIGFLLSSVFQGKAFLTPFQIFYEIVIGLFILLPVIGFAFLASAFAKKTPFFTFASPLLLILADKILDSTLGINIGVIDALMVYGNVLVQTKNAFLLQNVFVFDSTMILPVSLSILGGGLLIAAAIWLRDNRYEI